MKKACLGMQVLTLVANIHRSLRGDPFRVEKVDGIVSLTMSDYLADDSPKTLMSYTNLLLNKAIELGFVEFQTANVYVVSEEGVLIAEAITPEPSE